MIASDSPRVPDSVTGIGDRAFYSCGNLAGVTIPDSVADVGANPFVCCDELREIGVSPDHPYLEITDGVLFSKPDKRLICYPCAFAAPDYTVPGGTRNIGGSAFVYSTSLESRV